TMRLAQLSTLLHHANIETLRLRLETVAKMTEQPEVAFNSAFSALETYVVAHDVENVAQGLYHYYPRNHRLVCVRAGQLRDEVTEMCIGQARAGNGAITLLITAVWERYTFRYRHGRAYRTLLINVSELAQKYLVLATALRFSTFLTPNFVYEK